MNWGGRGHVVGEVSGPSDSSEVAEAFVRALYDDAAGPLFGYALRLTGDRARAEDVVQETLVRAWVRAQDLDLEPAALRGWLFTVARNLVTDLRRGDAARPSTVADDHALSVAPAADDLERAMLSWTVADALHRLTAQHRAVLEATFYAGHSVAEAAHLLGVPVGTVKSRTYYGLRALRLALEEVGAL